MKSREEKMESELGNLLKVCNIVFVSLTFCYFIIRKAPIGFRRLFFLLPIIFIFTLLPLKLSSMHAIGLITFLITWLANFKLLLFAFGQGPLSDPSISYLPFIFVTCLPIKLRHDPEIQKLQNDEKTKTSCTRKGLKSPFNYAIKILLLSLGIHLYNSGKYTNQCLMIAHLCGHVYLVTELVLAFSVAPVRIIFGFDMEPQFDDPYLSTSLQDFWGRRWNLMATSVLSQTVNYPVRRTLTPVLGKAWGLLSAVMATFLVSGLMHELLYYYQSGAEPTWEVTWFFVLQGFCMAMEIAVKKALPGRLHLHPAISGPLTIGFITVTSSWLLFPQLLRNGMVEKGIAEYGAFMEFIREEMLKPLKLV